jgi:heptosyltransferase-2
MTFFNTDRVEKVLIRSVNWVGDAVMATPAIGVLRECFPRAELTVLANPLVSQLFSPHAWVDRVITFDRNGVHRGLRGRLRLVAEVRKHSFDVAVILPNSFDSALIPWLAGIPARLGKSSDGRGFMLTGRYRPDTAYHSGHEVIYYLDLLRSFSLTGQAATPYLTTTPDEDREAAAQLAEQGIPTGTYLLGINPGATFGSAKRWYPERFAETARQLAERWAAKIVVFGGPGETDIAGDIEQRLAGECLNLAGRTSLRQLMALIKRCDFLVTNDSGPMHIAAAFGVPLTAIFGPTDDSGTSPYSNKAVIVRKDVDCAPCKLRECPTDHRCMTAVTAADVVQASIGLMTTLTADRRTDNPGKGLSSGSGDSISENG